jgi:hypothetical protein
MIAIKSTRTLLCGLTAAQIALLSSSHASHRAADALGRSFLPENIRNQVAVLDTNGNVILHVGRYGNAGDGVPLAPDAFRTGKPPSIGGDEVSLVHACYTATHTDHRLFISDAGNARIVSVKLEYHATERVPLKKRGRME